MNDRDHDDWTDIIDTAFENDWQVDSITLTRGVHQLTFPLTTKRGLTLSDLSTGESDDHGRASVALVLFLLEHLDS